MTKGSIFTLLVTAIGLTAACALQSARGAAGSVSGHNLAIVKVSAAGLEREPRVPVSDDRSMTVTEGKGATVGNRTPFASVDKRLQVDVSAYDQMTLALKDWPVDEFMYFVAGRVEIGDSSGRKEQFGPGDALVMPRGFSGTWRELSPIEKFAVSYSAPSAGSDRGRVIRVDVKAVHAAVMKPVGAPVPFARVLSGGSGFVELPAYRSADGAMSVDAKKYEPLELEMRGWPTDEFMVLESGEVEIVDAGGRAMTFKKGDALVIPRGFSGMWRQRVRTEMLTVNYGADGR